MDEKILLLSLENKIKERVPDFKIKFKNENTLMKIIGKIISPFNSDFMQHYITTLGKTVYFPNRNFYESNTKNIVEILSHEYVHILDYVNHPIKFLLAYSFPQILALPGVLFLLLIPVWLPLIIMSILSPWLLLILISLLFLFPIPSLGRKNIEIRGYGMSGKMSIWRYGIVPSVYTMEHFIKQFTGPAYYYMWPFKKQVQEQLNKYIQSDILILFNDENKAWLDVYNVLKDNGALHI